MQQHCVVKWDSDCGCWIY